MKLSHRVPSLVLALCAPLLQAQPPAAAKDAPPPGAAADGPLVVDVHPSPYRPQIYSDENVGHQRFDMRSATLLNLIATAYKKEDQAILGGPNWIEYDRYDLAAKIDGLETPKPQAPNADPMQVYNGPYDSIRPFLQRVLTERFHLKYHTEDRPLPGYILTVAKDGSKLTPAKDSDAPGTCKGSSDKANPGVQTVTCSSLTMERFLIYFGGAYEHPVIDHTGLTKSYDFSITFTYANMRTRDDYVRMYTDALKQIGLTVAAGDVPQPTIIIDSVDHPTANPPDIAKLIPPLPELEFEVATIKPAAEGEPQMIMPRGSQITFGNQPLQALLVRAFQLPTGAMLGNRPDWLNTTYYTIVVKLPPDVDARAVYQDEDLVDNMLQKLLVDRFQIKSHWGEETQDSWTLLSTPQIKMKKADPNSRSFCKYGPPDGEKDLRSGVDSHYDNESHCQNVTMTQFTELIETIAKSEVKNRVVDKTGLTGSYDLTLYYTSGRKLRTDQATADAAAKAAGNTSGDPVGGLTVQDAFSKELGLKLVKQPGSQPALILDHIEQTPTEN
jgi:uncharacterized protein (TIGR03435 family)